MGPLLNQANDLVRADMDDAIFSYIFPGKGCFQESQISEKESLKQGRLMLCRWASDESTLKATEHKQVCGKWWDALISVERTCWHNFKGILDYHENVLSWKRR